jgi:hypothetical protein
MLALQLYFSHTSLAPTGHVYYHNTITRESTYTRPPPASLSVLPSQPRKTNQEKPLFKAQIPSTDWFRVKTTEGNVFYSHKGRKESVWTVPDEIKDGLEQLEQHERRKEEQSKTKKGQMDKSEQGAPGTAKRKAEEPIPVDEVSITKKSRTDIDLSDENDEEDMSEDEEDEQWQLEAADQLAKEADELRRKREQQIEVEQDPGGKEDQVTESNQQAQSEQHIVPAKVDLSIEEAKALFKVSLAFLCAHIS